MTKSEIKIADHIDNKNGLTNPVICSQDTGYALSTCKRVFSKIAYKSDSNWYLLQGAHCALSIERELGNVH